jgi:predicted nicotinamide N-methyase
MVDELPAVARHLSTVLVTMADGGEIHALAHRLPFRESRLKEFLAHRAVVADRFDVASAVERLWQAAMAAERLAGEPALNAARSQETSVSYATDHMSYRMSPSVDVQRRTVLDLCSISVLPARASWPTAPSAEY